MILSEYFYMVVDEPSEFQGNHEAADTLMAYHAYRMGGRVIIRSSNTNVLVILIALAEKNARNFDDCDGLWFSKQPKIDQCNRYLKRA